MPALIALALSVGVLAVIDTWLFVVPLADFLPGLVWISFIAWGEMNARLASWAFDTAPPVCSTDSVVYCATDSLNGPSASLMRLRRARCRRPTR